MTTSPTAAAKTARFATKSNDFLSITRRTTQEQKTVLQNTAAQKSFDFSRYVGGNRDAMRIAVRHNPWPLTRHHTVHQTRLGRLTLVNRHARFSCHDGGHPHQGEN
jgi:hypothetical protein